MLLQYFFETVQLTLLQNQCRAGRVLNSFFLSQRNWDASSHLDIRNSILYSSLNVTLKWLGLKHNTGTVCNMCTTAGNTISRYLPKQCYYSMQGLVFQAAITHLYITHYPVWPPIQSRQGRTLEWYLAEYKTKMQDYTAKQDYLVSICVEPWKTVKI